MAVSLMKESSKAMVHLERASSRGKQCLQLRGPMLQVYTGHIMDPVDCTMIK